MISKIFLDEPSFGDDGKEYYTTDVANTIVSIFNYKTIELNGCIYTCNGIHWENLNKASEEKFYIYT